jgi:hypothetical protein
MNPTHPISQSAGPGTDWEIIVFAFPLGREHPVIRFTGLIGGVCFRSPIFPAARPCSGSLS